MNFLIQVPREKKFQSLQVFYTSPTFPTSSTHTGSDNLTIHFMDVKQGENIHHIHLDNLERINIFVLGDMIIPANYRYSEQAKESFLKEFFQHFTPDKLREMKGFFYIIQVESHNGTIKIYSSLFNILPVYYFMTADQYYISSGIESIRKSCLFPFTINKKFLLEKLLFNYAFLNDTIIEDIHLLAANCYLEFGPNLEIKKHTFISDYFVSSPLPWKKSIEEISELYLEMIPAYFPDKFFYMTLTGGFDGRTNVAAALKYHKNFSTFSYGSAGSPDIIIPRRISEKINIRYESFYLDDQYNRDEFLPHAVQLVEQTDANAGISRAHYLNVAQKLGHNIHILTGNFGSELMRSMHILGAMISPQLFDIFSNLVLGDRQKKSPKKSQPILFYGTGKKKLEQSIANNPNLRFLELENFKNELNNLISDIIQYQENLQHQFTLNQNFYVYMFEEVFRKYFGPEIIIQASCKLYNRSPYLDFGFIQALLRTELAGINSHFWESNPLIRFRGQVLYAHIIQKAFPALVEIPTDRLYKPADFFSLKGKLNIAASFFFRKYLKKQPLNSPDYNRKCYQTHMNYFKSLPIKKTGLFAEKRLLNFMESGEWIDSQDLFSHLMSLLIYISR